MAFLDAATLKTRLRIPAADTSQDLLLADLVASVNNELGTLFNLTPDCTTRAYTESYDVLDEVDGIWLKQYPVRTITSVTVDGVLLDADETYLDARTDVLGSLRRKRGGSVAGFAQFPAGPQIVTVVHTAGWDGGVVDASLTSAAVAIAVWLYNTEPKTGLESERIGQYAYKLASGAAGIGYGGANAGGMPAGAARVLAQWIRPFADWS